MGARGLRAVVGGAGVAAFLHAAEPLAGGDLPAVVHQALQ
jgi:hypothetical protein